MKEHFDLADIRRTLNLACEQITAEADLPPMGVIDALNLLINATLHLLVNPDDTLFDVVEACYDGVDIDDLMADIES